MIPPKAPKDQATDPYNNEDPTLKAAARSLMQSCIDDARADYARLDRDRQDWLNLLYYRGGVDHQWVVWDRTTNSWIPRPFDGESGLPEWVPRASTNIYARQIDGIVSILDQSTPAQEWRPSTDDDADIAGASVATEAIPVLREELGYDEIRRQMNKFVTLIDKCALEVYYDNDGKYGTSPIQAVQCPACYAVSMPMQVEEAGDACPECGQQEQPLEPAVDQQGPIGADYPHGKICGRLIPSFEFSLPRSARQSDEEMVPWILTHSRYSYEEALRAYPHASALLDKERKYGTSQKTGLQRHYADAMMRLSAPRAQRNATGTTVDQSGPVIYRIYHDPIEDDAHQFPEGLYAVMIEDEIVEFGPLPVKDDNDVPYKPVLVRTFAQAPGSPFNKPPADDLVPLQYWRNLVESLIALSLMHNAAPRTFIPMTVTLEDEISGQPGQNIRFRSHMPGERPFTEPGVNPAEGLYRYLEIIDAKFQELSGINNVLAGSSPKGDPTLGEVQILQERGMAAFKTPLDNLVEFEKRLSRMLLWIGKRSAWAPRFRKIKGENGAWEVSQFTATDLGGKVDVFCEPITAWPRSPIMQNLKLKEAVGMGVLIPQMDAELQQKILTMMDLAELKPSFDVDRKQIARHLDRWKAAHDPQELLAPDLVPQSWWNLQLHLLLKTNFMKTEEAEAMQTFNPAVYQAMQMHIAQIQQLVMMAQMQAAAAQAGPPAAEEKGPDGSAVDEAVKSGAIAPAGGQEDPLQAALAQGALQPAGAPGAEAAAAMPSIDDLIAGGVLFPAPQEPAPPPS